jgi:hypothetical protein
MSPTAAAHPTRSPLRAALRLRLRACVGRAPALLRQLGPYAAVELLLPGGSLLALCLWLYRRYRAGVQLRTARAPGQALLAECA